MKMAKKNAPAKAKNSYKEFSFESDNYNYAFTGRIYPDLAKTYGKVTSTPVSLTIDDLMSIKGCSLKQTDKNVWFSFPEYKNKEGDYVSYVYVDKETTAFDELAEYLDSLL